MAASPNTSLTIRHLRIVWRDTFVVEPPPPNFIAASRQPLLELPCYVSDSHVQPRSSQPDLLRVIDGVSHNVARVGHGDLWRVQLTPFAVADLRPTLARLQRSPRQLTPDNAFQAAQTADDEGTWLTVTPILLLHRAGVGIASYYASVDGPQAGYTPDQAIQIVRLGISRPVAQAASFMGHPRA